MVTHLKSVCFSMLFKAGILKLFTSKPKAVKAESGKEADA